MAGKKTIFNPDWTNEDINPEWSSWLKSVNNEPFKAHCTVCKKAFILSNMGKRAITSHEQSAKHKRNLTSLCTSLRVEDFFKKKNQGNDFTLKDIAGSSSAINELSIQKDAGNDTVPTNIPPSTHNMLDNYVTKKATLKAEIYWAMKLVTCHQSYNSSKDSADLFQLMFPDSKIAKSISLSGSKMSYLVSFGLSEYFLQVLKKDISDSKFVICFDEALNKVAQKGQMDLIIRFWSKTLNVVSTRYLNSVFLGHSTPTDLNEKFCEGTEELSLRNLIQISMDGPNVNLKMGRIISEELKNEYSLSVFSN